MSKHRVRVWRPSLISCTSLHSRSESRSGDLPVPDVFHQFILVFDHPSPSDHPPAMHTIHFQALYHPKTIGGGGATSPRVILLFPGVYSVPCCCRMRLILWSLGFLLSDETELIHPSHWSGYPSLALFLFDHRESRLGAGVSVFQPRCSPAACG